MGELARWLSLPCHKRQGDAAIVDHDSNTLSLSHQSYSALPIVFHLVPKEPSYLNSEWRTLVCAESFIIRFPFQILVLHILN